MTGKYLKLRQQEEIKRFDDEMAWRNFKDKFKPQIENGLSESQFRASHRYTQDDIKYFQRLEREVEMEQANHEAFLRGFCRGRAE